MVGRAISICHIYAEALSTEAFSLNADAFSHTIVVQREVAKSVLTYFERIPRQIHGSAGYHWGVGLQPHRT